MPEPHPWEKQPFESAKAYAAARAYFGLGPARSVAAAGRISQGLPEGPREKGKAAVASGHLNRWAATFRWVDRAAAWDAHCREIELEAAAAAARRQGEALADKRLSRAVQLEELAFAAVNLVAARLNDVMLKQGQARTKEEKPADEDIRAALQHIGLVYDRAKAWVVAHNIEEASRSDMPQTQPISLTDDEVAASMRAIAEHRKRVEGGMT
jgi:hypothetical protein